MSLSATLGDGVQIEVGGETVVLKPTLRAGIGVLRLHGSFQAAVQRVLEVNTYTIAEVINLGGGRLDGGNLLARGGLMRAAALADALAAYIVILANGGTKPSDAPQAKADASSGETHETYFCRLFKIGTGWMGWTPDQTLDAPIAAIVSAHAGRTEMLGAIFGVDGAKPRNEIPLEDKVRAFFQHVGTRRV